MLFVLQMCAEDKFTGAVLSRDVGGKRHVVDPHDNKMKEPIENLVW